MPGTSKKTKVWSVRLNEVGGACISELAKRKKVSEAEAHKLMLKAGAIALLTETGVNSVAARVRAAQSVEED
jgi:hypothetical protein